MTRCEPIGATRRAEPPPSLGTLLARSIRGMYIRALRLTMMPTVRFRMGIIDTLPTVWHRPSLIGFDRPSNSSTSSKS